MKNRVKTWQVRGIGLNNWRISKSQNGGRNQVSGREKKEEIATTENELHIIRNERTKGIILRAKAKWNVEGERSSNYFCNLEKRHYKEKIIPKITHNGHDLTDKRYFMKAQKEFYEMLYTSRNCIIERRHENAFLITKILLLQNYQSMKKIKLKVQ